MAGQPAAKEVGMGNPAEENDPPPESRRDFAYPRDIVNNIRLSLRWCGKEAGEDQNYRQQQVKCVIIFHRATPIAASALRPGDWVGAGIYDFRSERCRRLNCSRPVATRTQ